MYGTGGGGIFLWEGGGGGQADELHFIQQQASIPGGVAPAMVPAGMWKAAPQPSLLSDHIYTASFANSEKVIVSEGGIAEVFRLMLDIE
jgi:hypothetical protein